MTESLYLSSGISIYADHNHCIPSHEIPAQSPAPNFKSLMSRAHSPYISY